MVSPSIKALPAAVQESYETALERLGALIPKLETVDDFDEALSLLADMRALAVTAGEIHNAEPIR